MHLTADSKGRAIMFHTMDLYHIPFFSFSPIIVISTCICITRWAVCLQSGYHASGGVCSFSPSWQHQYARSGSIAWLKAFRPFRRRSSHGLAVCAQIEKSVASMNFQYNNLLKCISIYSDVYDASTRWHQQCRHSSIYRISCHVRRRLPRWPRIIQMS
jgi:hypothetical protein